MSELKKHLDNKKEDKKAIISIFQTGCRTLFGNGIKYKQQQKSKVTVTTLAWLPLRVFYFPITVRGKAESGKLSHTVIYFH